MVKEKFLIKGLGGAKKLKGTISVGGSKNTALKLLASTILFEDTVNFQNVPDIADIRKAVELLQSLGGKCERTGPNSYSINTRELKNTILEPSIAKQLRASIVFTGPILSRFGKVSFPHPGGDVIGERPIDIFLDSLKKMGAKLAEKSEEYSLSVQGSLKGVTIIFKVVSVTATETMMMAAILAKGKTILKNAATEPEIKHLGEFLISCGAKIKGVGTSTIEIEGGKILKAGGKVYRVPPDRIETGSFLILGALSANRLEITNCEPSEVEVPIEILRQSGVNIEVGKNKITVGGKVKGDRLKGVSIKTHEYPGFPTDLQAPMVVYLTQAYGESFVFETIFEGRLLYVDDLNRMGANILILDQHRIIVKGPTPLKGRELESPDIRAGLAFLIAAVVARGESVINNVYQIDRGYEKLEKRLRLLGLAIDRVR